MNTESTSRHNDLELMGTDDLLRGINQEDQTVAVAVELAIPQIKCLVDAVYEKMNAGGRLFYLGAGTSGRLGIVDASECPPTFGVDFDRVIGLIAGGDRAIRRAVENAEDDENQGFEDLKAWNVNANDFVIGIAASGRTPYVAGALQACNELGAGTGCVVCNSDSKVAKISIYPVEIITGPEFVTGSTRMKAGTATKMALNMITTSVMIKLGHVKGNKMVDMQLTNQKLVERGTKMIVEETGLTEENARQLLLETGSVRKAVDVHRKGGN
jgi:N-acetylmuramic acid 6-phosphate etherase